MKHLIQSWSQMVQIHLRRGLALDRAQVVIEEDFHEAKNADAIKEKRGKIRILFICIIVSQKRLRLL